MTAVQALTVEHRRAIDLAKERLVLGAEAWLDELDRLYEPGTKRLSHSQLRNLIAIAMETESPAVVTNYIRYQIGRAGRNDPWIKPESPGGTTGDRLISELETGTVQEALALVEGSATQSLDVVTSQRARIALIRHFLGFASRYLKYLESRDRNRGGRR